MIRKMHMSAIISGTVRMYSISLIHFTHMIQRIFLSGETRLVFPMILSMSDSIFRMSIFRPHVGKDRSTISIVIDAIIASIYLVVRDSEISSIVFSINNIPRKNGKVR